MGFSGPDREWEMGSVGEGDADRLMLQSMEEEQAEDLLKAHLTSLGEQFRKLELKEHRGHNWFQFYNRLRGITGYSMPTPPAELITGRLFKHCNERFAQGRTTLTVPTPCLTSSSPSPWSPGACRRTPL